MGVRRELLDHVVVFNERHLLRLVGEFVAYYSMSGPASMRAVSAS
jgi:hypothetical protein